MGKLYLLSFRCRIASITVTETPISLYQYVTPLLAMSHTYIYISISKLVHVHKELLTDITQYLLKCVKIKFEKK